MTAVLILVAALVVAIAAYGFACDARRWFAECRWLDEWLWDRDQRAALGRLRRAYSDPVEADPLERQYRMPCAPDPRRLV